jgi:quinol-cytochrome oxidoreductase complex cytochrome b subunit
MKTSRVVTKIVIRLFFLLLLMALVPPFFMGDQNKLKNIYLAFRHKWEIIFPAILIISFVTLLIIGAVKKFRETDLNWLLVLNTVILTIYGIAIYVKVLHMMN